MAESTIEQNAARYRIPHWGQGYFEVGPAGHLVMRPSAGAPAGVDLKLLVDDLRRRGIPLPVLLRFPDLLRARLERLVQAFQQACSEYDYRGEFRGVYPIKVNQQQPLVQDVLRFSQQHHLGLEAGSKPELLVVLSMLEDPEALIICNGYKDRSYIEMALLARRLRRNCIIVIEKMSELELVLSASTSLGIAPVIGLRAKLSAPGSGRWKDSVGDRAKFGLNIPEIMALVRRLQRSEQLDALRLLHFHIGSQVSDIRSVKGAMREATRIYSELVRLGAPMSVLDVGGGLGVDYDGTRSAGSSSINYDVQEYAYDVVAAVAAGCEQAGIEHPTLVTEAGRYTVAHSSVLVFDVLGTSEIFADQTAEQADAGIPDSPAVEELREILAAIGPDKLQEPYHDAVEIKEETLTRFNLGLCGLEERARVDRLFWSVCQRISHEVQQATHVPEELEPIQQALADTYFCNFSLFQSAPDSWAVDQLFPICPIHRLDEPPTARAVLADITCDSDGKIDRFIGRRPKRLLELHSWDGGPYTLGMFLLGAYQEILGDLHNLFGDTHVVHVSAADRACGYRLDHVLEGDTIKEVLQYVQYERRELVARLRQAVEAAIEEERCSIEEGARLIERYQRELEGYTYLGL